LQNNFWQFSKARKKPFIITFQPNEYESLVGANSTQNPAMKKGYGLAEVMLVMLACSSFLTGRYSSTGAPTDLQASQAIIGKDDVHRSKRLCHPEVFDCDMEYLEVSSEEKDTCEPKCSLRYDTRCYLSFLEVFMIIVRNERMILHKLLWCANTF
jgi:hypothetical protein